ncbi:sugar MFS transporter [Erwinia sp. SLM-02]|uniref:sugar MFS transporter n=1 Tax=Erwinia sp. SLM-02 TaxID=3020057 RepID=UPI00307FD68E
MSTPAAILHSTKEDHYQINTPLKLMVFSLFFMFGSITSLNDVLIPKLKELFQLTYMESMLVQSAFFFAYFTASIPASRLIIRFGYVKSAIAGLLIMGIGCLAFIPATHIGLFPAFLGALFLLAVGVTVIQVVANPLITLLGSARSASIRLTLGHGFNSLGTTIAPWIGAIFILGAISGIDLSTLHGAELAAAMQKETAVIGQAYTAIAVVIFLFCAAMFRFKSFGQHSAMLPKTNLMNSLNLFSSTRFRLGFISLFLYVGAEVTIGSILVNYLTHGDVMAITPEQAGKYIAFYWGGAMVGRFIGSALMKIISPAKILFIFSAMVITLIAVSMNSHGELAGFALLTVGLFNSIMFPTIFSLSCSKLNSRSAEGSGLLCCAIVGGGFIPPITGLLADIFTLKLSLIIPAACYLLIFLFGTYCAKQGD